MRQKLVIMIVPLLLPVLAEAQTYDALSDWNPSTNTTANTWQYGTETTLGSTMTLFSQNGSSPSFANWWSFTGGLTGPVIAFNSSGGILTIPGVAGDPYNIVWPSDELLIAPGAKNGTPNNTVLRWVAPSTGTFNITGQFSDLQAATTSMYIQQNGSMITSFSYGLPDHQADVPFSISNLAVTQGQDIDFVVNSGGDDGNDVLGISATIAPVTPEPSSACLLLVASTVGLLRRRR